MAWNKYLTSDELRSLREAAVAAGLATKPTMAMLKGEIPARFTGNLPGYDLPPNLQLKAELDRMNTVRQLSTGEVPLLQYVQAMQEFADDATHRAVFTETLTLIETRRTGAPPAPPMDAAMMRAATPAAAPVASEPFATRAGANTSLTQEAVIGQREMWRPVRYLADGARATASVFKILVHRHFGGNGQVVDGEPVTGSGTGWVIAPGLAITNHHVINARIKWLREKPASAQDFTLQAETAKVFFDYFDTSYDETGHILGQGALLAADEALDFALLRLPAALNPRAPLEVSSGPLLKSLDAGLNARVNVLQHPNGGPMKLGFRNNYVVVGDNDILAYLTDTETGSSGSPVMDDRWRVVALHYGAQKISGDGIELPGQPAIVQENVGTPLPSIMAHLQANHPALHAEITAAQPFLN